MISVVELTTTPPSKPSFAPASLMAWISAAAYASPAAGSVAIATSRALTLSHASELGTHKISESIWQQRTAFVQASDERRRGSMQHALTVRVVPSSCRRRRPHVGNGGGGGGGSTQTHDAPRPSQLSPPTLSAKLGSVGGQQSVPHATGQATAAITPAASRSVKQRRAFRCPGAYVAHVQSALAASAQSASSSQSPESSGCAGSWPKCVSWPKCGSCRRRTRSGASVCTLTAIRAPVAWARTRSCSQRYRWHLESNATQMPGDIVAAR